MLYKYYFGYENGDMDLNCQQKISIFRATAPPSPPNKNNSLTKKDSVEVTIEDEVQKQTTQNLNAPMKPSEKRRRAKASTKAINVHMQKRSEKNRYSVSKTKVEFEI